MSNRRDGGQIIIGIDEDKTNHRFIQSGLDESQFSSWSSDYLNSQFVKFTEPYIKFTLDNTEYNGKKFVAINIQEFDQVPVICKKDYSDKSGNTIIREGAFYVKTFGIPESNEKVNYIELRTLFELATQKGVQKFVTQARAAGLNLSANTQVVDSDLFNKQIAEYSNPTIENIRSRGYWQVIVRPTKFNEKLIPNLGDLEPIIDNSIAQIARDTFPSIILNKALQKGQDWIGQTIDYNIILEDWRLYQNGLFIDLFGIREDWYERLNSSDLEIYTPGTILIIERVIFHLTQIFSFASRLALSEIYNDEANINIDITINDLQNRELKALESLRGIVAPITYRAASLPKYSYNKAIPRADLIANPLGFAQQVAQDIFYRFNLLNISPNIIRQVMNNFR